jgi:hypothetical protein
MKHLFSTACAAALCISALASPAAAVSFVNGTGSVSLDRTDDFSWTVNFAATNGTNLPGTTGAITFNFLSANAAGTAWNFSYLVDNNSTAPSLSSRLGSFGFNAAPNAMSVTAPAANRFDPVRNGNGNFNGLGNREICFFSGPNCNGAGNNGVTVGEAPVAGSFSIATSASSTLVLDSFVARWQATGANAGGSNSGRGVIAAIPEPTTWAMMFVGFGMMAATMRYRRRDTKVVYA